MVIGKVKKVTDPKKKATDPVLLSHLAKAGIDKDYVEFEDYSAAHPMAKFYKDLRSGKRFQVISGLPMVRSDDGSRIQPKFEPSRSKWYFGNNMFEGEVLKAGKISLVSVIDTSSGVLAGSYVHWNPKLYVGGIEVEPVSGPVLLAIDPVNSHYSNNVLEWDYGYCKRWLRVIEGRFMERWVFQQNPGAEVRIVHNRTGEKGLFRLGPDAIDDDVEFVPLAVFQLAEYPFVISATSTFYPTDGSYEDGIPYHIEDNIAWGTLVGGAGTGANYSQSLTKISGFLSGTASGWKEMYRGIIIMLTSSIPDTDEITAATFSLNTNGGKDDQNSAAPVTNLYSADPANNNFLVAGDFDSLGTTEFCDNGITYAAWGAGYNDWALNAAGLDALSKTGPSKLGVRFECDAKGQEPNRAGNGTVTRIYAYTVEQGAGFKPKLVITHIPPDIEESLSASFEVEASMGRKLTFPLSSLMEVEAEAGRHLAIPLSALIEIEAYGILRAGIHKALSASFEIEAEAGRHLVLPLSALIEVEAVGNLGLIKALSALIEIEAIGGKRIGLFSKSDVLINIWNEETQVN